MKKYIEPKVEITSFNILDDTFVFTTSNDLAGNTQDINNSSDFEF